MKLIFTLDVKCPPYLELKRLDPELVDEVRYNEAILGVLLHGLNFLIW